MAKDSEGKNTLQDENLLPDLKQAKGVFTPEVPDTTDKKLKKTLPDSLKTKHITKADSLHLKAKQDSLAHVAVLAKDSTARIAYFRYQREDYPNSIFDEKKKSSFFVYPSESMLSRVVTLDSSGTKVTIKELLGGKPYRIFLEMPIEDFIQRRVQNIYHSVWETQAREYKIKSDKKELSQFLTDITSIDIPLPSSPLLSIFGKPVMNLKIAGQVDIHGAWRSQSTSGVTTSALGNTTNEPDFKQQVQINLNGTIGDKLTISADWNTERQFQYENQLKIKYTGFEDEIIQSIEAGNVSLETSPLVGGSEALFGVKAKFKMGPFSLTALASQKKSEVQEVSLSSGAKTQLFELHAYDYSPNHFFLDTIYADPQKNIFNNYYGNSVPQVNSVYLVKEIEVWKSYSGIANPNTRKASAFIYLPGKPAAQLYPQTYRNTSQADVTGRSIINNTWLKLEAGIDYVLHPETGYISFKSQIQDQDAIAVAYRIENQSTGTQDDIFYGEFLRDHQGMTDSTLILKLIKPRNLQPGTAYSTAWKLQLRNIYPVGGHDIKKDGFQLDIKYQTPGQTATSDYNGIKLLQAFGLDKTDPSGTSSQPDGAFDYFPDRTVMPSTGEIIFPVLEPFGRDFPSNLPDILKYQSVYDTTLTFAKQDNTKDKFTITGQYSASVSSNYSIGFNVVENSVKVYLGGNQLVNGQDYSVDYNMGQITIRNDKALVPGADLKITYEQNDLFQLASKTLLGFRGLFEFNRETTLGFSFLNLNQQTLSDKVRIGEEPLNNSLYGLDFKTNMNLPFVTKALGKVFSTSAPSSLILNAEYAYMSPDPNTKKSTISSDNGQSIAYIDDFEGAKKLIPLSMGYPQWHDISIPDNLPFIGALPQMTPDMPASYPNFVDAQMNYKSKLYWYNITPSNVTVKDIYGNRKTAAPDQNQIQTLDIAYDPTSPGAYNWTPTLSDPTKNWAGIMTVLSSTANNLVDENIEFIEFYLKIDQAPPNLKLNIDLGQISEDVIPNGQLDTEDKNSNGLVDDGEDTGIDGLFDKDEPGYNPSTNPDPSHDDYSFQLGNGDYSHVNGTEGNVVAIDQGKLPDSEDLNGNFTLDRLNSYYRYTIPVDTNKNVNKYVQGGGGGGGNSGWYLISIPLKDFTEQIGNPSLSVVQFIRFWISGASSKVHLRFAEMNLVGNQWQKVLNSKVTLQDTVLTVSTVSVEDNPDYVKPPGVQQELDKTQPNYTIYKNEQSLNLVLKNLQDGDNREIERYFTRTLDVFNYKEMKFFIHGDLNTLPGSVSEYIDSNNYGSEVYLRFGSDSVNYYEYRQPVRPDWNEVGLVFANLTAFKLRRDSSTAVVSVPVPGEPGHYYGVRGNPTLTSVSFFTIGILNPKDKGRRGQSVSGNVWIDELRVVGADQTPGWSYTANAALQLADVMRVSANISRTNPYFHKLNESFGNRQDNLNWGMAVDFDMLKVIPLNLAGSNMRISYSRNESYTNPLFLPGTDIKISDAQDELRRTMTEQGVNPADIVKAVNDLQTATQTKNVSQTWTLSSMRIKVPTDIWYIRDLVNNITLGVNYNKTTGNSPTTETSDSWIWNANLGYSVQLNRDLFFKPATIPYLGPFFDFFTDYKDFKIYYAPQSITASITASRRRSFSLTRAQSTFDGSTTSTTTTNLVIQPTVLRDFSATRSAGFTWQLTEGGLWNISLNYNFDISSTLAYLLADSTTERSESQIWRSIFGGQLFGKDISYKQTVDIRTSPKLPSLWDLNRYINLNASYTVTYNWQNNLTQGDLGRSAGYSNRISAGFSFRLKSIFAPLFKESEKENQPGTSGDRQQSQQQNVRTGGRRSARANGQLQSLNEQRSPGNDAGITHSDTSKMKKDTLGLSRKDVKVSPNYLNKSLDYLKFFIKTVFFDYDQISVDLSQSSSYTGGGLAGEGTGFNNFWGFSQSDSKGPDRLFMLGLSNDLGLRNLGINTSITDNFTQRNDIDFKTTKPLWEGAQLDLSWKVGFGISRSSTFQADSIGGMKILSNTTTGTIERSFLSLPPIPLLSFLGNSGIKKVHDLYDPNSANPDAGLSDAFVQGFETFSFLEKVPILSKLAKYIPRPNWSFNWSGLEKYEFLSFAKRITISHAYVSNYSEGWMINPDGTKEIQSQIVDYGFQPLIGISFDFNKFFDGTLQSTIRYSTRSSYSLGASTHNITQAFTRDINITASYLRSGFEIPLFGISLKNDLEISFSYTIGQSSSIIFDLDNWIDSGTPQDGKTNTVIGPKIKYVMSQRVTLSIFYTRTKIEPEGASRLIPTTTNEAGIDVRISIQ